MSIFTKDMDKAVRERDFIEYTGEPRHPHLKDSGPEKEFIDYVRGRKSIGYGRMIQIISSHWYQYLRTDGLGHDAAKKGSRWESLVLEDD